MTNKLRQSVRALAGDGDKRVAVIRNAGEFGCAARNVILEAAHEVGEVIHSVCGVTDAEQNVKGVE